MINCHTHLFTKFHVPPELLKLYITLPDITIDWIASILDSRFGVWLLNKLNHKTGSDIKRYINFLKFGYHLNIEEQFSILIESYPQDTKFVVLMQNFDFIGEKEPTIRYNSFAKEIFKLKVKYPNIILPFHFMEPRIIQYTDDPFKLVENYKDDFEKGFCQGLKMYPAEGYFPQDYRLIELYKYAEQNNIPILTHVSTGGSRYVRPTIKTEQNYFDLNKEPIQIKLPIIGNRGTAREYTKRARLFSDPNNYIEILTKFPKLKLCLAHSGSEEEYQKELINRKTGKSNPNWYRTCLDLVDKYENVYMDIAFSLIDKNFLKELILVDFDFSSQNPIIKKRCERLLFGTDFYLTYAFYYASEENLSHIEQKIWNDTLNLLNPHLFNKISKENPIVWLTSKYFK